MDPVIPNYLNLFYIVTLVCKSLESEARQELKALGLNNFSDFAVLEILDREGPLPVNHIGQRIALTSGSITTAVDRLERRKWVTRRPGKSDRRVVEVRITPAGRKVKTSALEAVADVWKEPVAKLTDEQQEQMIRQLQLLLPGRATLDGET